MKLFEYIERINLLHKLIKDRKTGNPEKFAKRLGISTVRLYQMIEELKIMQAPICYSKKDKTYYYCRNFEISAKLTFTPLDDDELINLNAGFSFQSLAFNNFFKL
jgi:predicted DNA-binding transcriptional regulator YafY